MWKLLLYVLAVAVIVTLGLVLEVVSRAPTHHQPHSDAQLAIYATGNVEGATNESFLHAQTKGRVVELTVQQNDRVKKGAILLRLDDDLQQFERALAAAHVAAAQAQLERLVTGAQEEERQEAEALYQARQAERDRAEKAWLRTEALVRDGVGTLQSGEDDRAHWEATIAQAAAAKARRDLLLAPARQDEVRRLEAEVAAMEARLEIAEAQLERTRLRAPMDCRVLQVNVELGELTGPEATTAPVVVADMSTLRVRAFVEELDALRVQVGMLARVEAPGSSKTFQGKVTRLSPRMATKRLFSDRPGELYDTKTREVWIELEKASFAPGAELGDVDGDESREGLATSESELPTDELLIGLRVDVFIEAP